MSKLTEEKTLNRLWKQIDKNFRWNRVIAVMAVLDWKWAGRGVPNLEQLKTTAKYLVSEALKGKTSHGTGGFMARWYINDEDKESIELEFTIESWEAR